MSASAVPRATALVIAWLHTVSDPEAADFLVAVKARAYSKLRLALPLSILLHKHSPSQSTKVLPARSCLATKGQLVIRPQQKRIARFRAADSNMHRRTNLMGKA